MLSAVMVGTVDTVQIDALVYWFIFVLHGYVGVVLQNCLIACQPTISFFLNFSLKPTCCCYNNYLDVLLCELTTTVATVFKVDTGYL